MQPNECFLASVGKDWLKITNCNVHMNVKRRLQRTVIRGAEGDHQLDADELAEGTNRTRFDNDGDGAWDGHEVNYFDTDPLGPDDADSDLIPDWYDLDRNGEFNHAV